MEFSKEKTPTQSKFFSKRYFLVLFLLIFSVIIFASTYTNADAAYDDNFNKKLETNFPGVNKQLNTIAEEANCDFLKTPGKCLLLPLFHFSGDLLKMSGTIFNWIINTDNIKLILTSPALYKIWTYVRDLLNMAFIMVLLFSAFCTIFQIEQYNYKKLLWKIVLMALLVNFSFPITRFIIDASNILMYSVIKSSFFTDSQAYSSIGKIAANSPLATLITQKTWPDAASLLGATVMLFMLAITFLAIGVLLLIRVIALAILLIFSPVAFAGSIIPGISAQASKWWDNLFKYSFFGPIMIIGVAIAVELMNGIGKDLTTKAIEAAGGQAGDNATFIGSMVSILVPIVLLWMVMGVAQSMSIAGAGAVMGAAQKAMKWPGKAAWWGIKKGAKKFERDVLASRGLSPRAFIEGWKQRGQEAEDKAIKPAAGRWRDKMNKFFRNEETHYEDVALQGNILKEQKELSDVSQESEYLLRQFNATAKSTDSRKAQKMAAILRIMFNNNDQNEFMKGFNESVEPEHMKQFIYTKLVDAGMTEEQAAKQMMDYSEIAESKGNYGNYAMGIYDKDANNGNGVFRLSTPEEQRKFSVAKGTNVESQIKMRNWHWNSFLTENVDGTTGDLHDMGKSMLSSLTQSEVGQMSRVRKDFLNRLYEKKDQIVQHAEDLEKSGKAEDREQAKTVRTFMEEIEKYKFSKPKEENPKPKKPAGFGR